MRIGKHIPQRGDLIFDDDVGAIVLVDISECGWSFNGSRVFEIHAYMGGTFFKGHVNESGHEVNMHSLERGYYDHEDDFDDYGFIDDSEQYDAIADGQTRSFVLN